MKDDLPIRQLHASYCALTGLEVPLTMGKIFSWDAWMAHGWSETDLRLVVDHKKRTVKPRERLLKHLAFRYLVQDPENFAEDLAEARALARAKPLPPAKAEALRATGRPADPPTATVKSAAQILRESALLRELLAKEGL